MNVSAGGPVSAADHYEALLAEHYTWMSGGLAAKVAEQRALFEGLGIAPAGSRRALDLGCGPGFQSLALAGLGFTVTAVDTSRRLLDELAANTGSLPVTALEGDIRSVPAGLEPGFDVAVCMGDTLPHLPDKGSVVSLFGSIHRLLAPGGAVVLSFRDLGAALTGTDRFIPVRSDADRILTCFLEYEPDSVIVHDLVHVREGAGWSLRKSSYRKLRLGLGWVVAELERAGFTVRSAAAGRMCVVVARRS